VKFNSEMKGYITPKVTGILFWVFSIAFVANTVMFAMDARDGFTLTLAALSTILGVVVIRVACEFLDVVFAIHRRLAEIDVRAAPEKN